MKESLAEILILTDGKPGHQHQAEAFAGLRGCPYRLVAVRFRSRAAKALSYILDRFGLYASSLFTGEVPQGDFGAVAAAGSETYYAAKTVARRLGIPAVAIMLPKGYRYDFDLIVAQEHDRPPKRRNIVTLPVNLCQVKPQGIVVPQEGVRYVAVILGGDNKVFAMDASALRQALSRLFALFPAHRFVVTTSRRTPQAVEALLPDFPFESRIVYSQNPVNPIPDFLAMSDYVFISADSTSMISEAVTFGSAAVEILPLRVKKEGSKHAGMVEHLEALGCVHVFDGTLGDCRRKLDLGDFLQEGPSCA